MTRQQRRIHALAWPILAILMAALIAASLSARSQATGRTALVVAEDAA